MKMKNVSLAFLVLLLLLTSCKGADSGQTTSQSPEAVFTAAAQTAEARRLLRPTDTPTVSADALIATSKAVTPTLAPVTAAPTAAVTQPAAQATKPAANAPVSANDRAEFVSDVSVPDGTIFAPNEPFVKTWQIKNTGTTTWTTDYALMFIDGELMSAAPTVQLPGEVAPGATVDISVDMVAPEKDGIFQGYWKLINANREVFGVGADAADAIWLIISVSQNAQPVNTVSPSLAGGAILTKIKFAVDPPSFEGTCPKSFVFSGQFTLTRAATVTYSLEAGNSDGTGIKLPSPITRNLEAGTHTVSLELMIAYSMNGWARLKFIAPEEIVTDQVSFTLACK